MPIDRCICFNTTFADLKEGDEAHHHGAACTPELRQCGHGCGLCLPYIEAMRRTGRVVFEVNDAAVTFGRV